MFSESPREECDARVACVQPLGRGVRQAFGEDHGLVTRHDGATVNDFMAPPVYYFIETPRLVKVLVRKDDTDDSNFTDVLCASVRGGCAASRKLPVRDGRQRERAFRF